MPASKVMVTIDSSSRLVTFDDQIADCERPSRIVPFSETFPSPFTRTLRMPLVRPLAEIV